jgi:hypothetical protein
MTIKIKKFLVAVCFIFLCEISFGMEERILVWRSDDFSDSSEFSKCDLAVLAPIYRNWDFNEDFLSSVIRASSKIPHFVDIILRIDDHEDKIALEMDSISRALRDTEYPPNTNIFLKINGRNLGSGPTRNKLLEDVSTIEPKNFCFLDADDIVHPLCFRIMLNFMLSETAPTVILGEFAIRQFDERTRGRIANEFSAQIGESSFTLANERFLIAGSFDLDGRKVLGTNTMCYPPVFFRYDRDSCLTVIDENRQSTDMQDIVMYYVGIGDTDNKCWHLYPKEENQRAALLLYRQHSDSISHTNSREAFDVEKIGYKLVLESLEALKPDFEHNPDLVISRLKCCDLKQNFQTILGDQSFSDYHDTIREILRRIDN